MKHKRNNWFIILPSLFLCCSCHNYQAFDILSSQEVENVCNAYSLRRCDSGKMAKYVKIKYLLGYFEEYSAIVSVVEFKEPGTTTADVIKDYYIQSTTLPIDYRGKYTLICSINASHDLDVFVSGKGSFTIQDAYDNKYLSDSEINKIIENFKKLH